MICIAATNFPQSLDKALIRPGRFDRHVTVPNPDVKGRKEILEVHFKNVPAGKDVDLKVGCAWTACSTITYFVHIPVFSICYILCMVAAIQPYNAIQQYNGYAFTMTIGELVVYDHSDTESALSSTLCSDKITTNIYFEL